MDPENNFPTRRYTEVAAKLKPSMSGFRTIAEETRFDEMGKPNTRQMQAVARTGSHPAVGGGKTSIYGRVGGRTGQHARVGGGKTSIYGRVGGQTGQHGSVGVKTQMMPRVGGYTSHYGSVSSQQSPVRKAQERSRRRQDIDPTVAILIGVGVFMFALLVYGISKPTTYVQEAAKVELSKDEQNRLARAINVERAKQAEILYRDEPVAQTGQATQPRVVTPPPGSVIIRSIPAPAQEAAPRMQNTAPGGIAAGFSGQNERMQQRAPDVIIVQDEIAAPVIPAKPPLPQGGIAAGMMKPDAERRSNPAMKARTDSPTTLVAAPAAPVAAPTAATPGVKVQRSKKTAPHGGTMYEIGPGVAMLEFALDRQTGSLSMYVLDTVKLSRIVVRQPFIELQSPAYAQTFNLRAGNGSAQFSGQYEVLRDNRETVKVLIPSMVVNGTEVTDIGVEF